MTHPNVARIPTVLVDLPDSRDECFREGWVQGQLTVFVNYWRKKGEPLSKSDIVRLKRVILEGRKK